MLAKLLGITEEEVKLSLKPEGALNKVGLLEVDMSDSYQIADKLDLLTGSFAEEVISQGHEPLDFLSGVVKRSERSQLSIDQFGYKEKEISSIASYIRESSKTKQVGVNILFYGLPGTGKTELSRVIGAYLGKDLLEVATTNSCNHPLNPKTRLKALNALQSVYVEKDALILIDEVGDIFHTEKQFGGKDDVDYPTKAWLNKILEENLVPTIWVMNSSYGLDPAIARRFDMVLEFEAAPRSYRKKLIEEKLSKVMTPSQVEALADAQYLTPAVLENTARVLNTLEGQFTAEHQNQTATYLLNSTLNLQGVKEVDFSVNGLPSFYSTDYVESDLDLHALKDGVTKHGSARLCLYGPPGTGKTAYGRYLAKQLDKPLMVKKVSDLVSSWVGGTERNLAEAFDQAKKDGAVLLIDEVDSFLQDRRGVRNSWEVTAVNEMLTQMESFDGVFIATTNLVDNLDQAALRRFDLKTKLDYLSKERMQRLFVQYCHQLEITPIDVAKVEFIAQTTPGDFAAIARRHKFAPITTPAALHKALKEECSIKQPEGRSIGFL